MSQEEWKPIAGYDGYYEVSNRGRVRSLDRVTFQKNRHGGLSRYERTGVVLKQTLCNGYPRIMLHKDGVTKTFLVHRLVATAFLEKNGNNIVNHRDNNPKNNDVTNLEWCTQSHNIQYAYNNGTKTPPHQKKVIQCTIDGDVVKVWDSAAQAARAIGCDTQNIGKVCRGERFKAGGFSWKFAE